MGLIMMKVLTELPQESMFLCATTERSGATLMHDFESGPLQPYGHNNGAVPELVGMGYVVDKTARSKHFGH